MNEFFFTKTLLLLFPGELLPFPPTAEAPPVTIKTEGEDGCCCFLIVGVVVVEEDTEDFLAGAGGATITKPFEFEFEAVLFVIAFRKCGGGNALLRANAPPAVEPFDATEVENV